MTDGDTSRLSDRDHVRLRAGMYVGDCSFSGLHHMASELINNSLNEVIAGRATTCSVTIHLDESLTVEDDGHGISVANDAEESARQGRNVSVLETAMTRICPREKSRYENSWSVGLKTVNFLSGTCKVTVWRDGFEHELCFVQGERVGDLRRVGPTSKHGTRITFHADPAIFNDQAKFAYDRLAVRLQELAYLHPAFTARLHDERTREFHFDQGICQLVEKMTFERVETWYRRSWSPIHSDVWRLEAEAQGFQLEVALKFSQDETERIRIYVNDELMPEGGTPLTGLRKGVCRAIQDYGKRAGGSCDIGYLDEDRWGLSAVIAVRLRNPQFAGGRRSRIENPEVETVTEAAVYDYLSQQFESHPEVASQIWQHAVDMAQERFEEC
jgi:DNA gyrase subunit B